MQYYMFVNGQQVGPFEAHLLSANGLNPTTQVWCETMTNWAPAHTVAELAPYLTPAPAPAPAPQQYQPQHQHQPQQYQPQQYQQPQQQYQPQQYQQPQQQYQPQQYQQPQPAYAGGAYGQRGGYQQPYQQGGYQQQYQSADPTILSRQRKVGFGEAISRGFKQYATFEGRASRSEYWWWVLFCSLISITVIGPLVVLVPSLAICWRRLHDTGRSGAWYLMTLIPYVNIITGIILLVWFCQESKPETNQYGPVPNVD